MEACVEMRDGVGERWMAEGVQGWGWVKALRVKDVAIVFSW